MEQQKRPDDVVEYLSGRQDKFYKLYTYFLISESQVLCLEIYEASLANYLGKVKLELCLLCQITSILNP